MCISIFKKAFEASGASGAWASFQLLRPRNPRKCWYLLHRSHLALEMAARACPSAARALEMAAGACPNAARALEMAARACPGAASALEMTPRACPGAARVLEMAARARPSAARVLEMAARVCPGAAKALEITARASFGAPSALDISARTSFGAPTAFVKAANALEVAFRIAVRRIYARYHETLLHYALVHGCAQDHTSLGIHIKKVAGLRYLG